MSYTLLIKKISDSQRNKYMYLCMVNTLSPVLSPKGLALADLHILHFVCLQFSRLVFTCAQNAFASLNIFGCVLCNTNQKGKFVVL